MRAATGALSGAALMVLAGSALADPGNGYGPHPGMMGWGGWIMGPIMMVIFFALLIAAVFVVLRLLGIGPGRNPSGGSDRSLEILRERFARGEIDKSEFEERKNALG